MQQPDTTALYHSSAGHRRAQALYESYLAAITTPYEAYYVDTPGGLTHVLVAGPQDAAPVILFHGNSLFGPHWAAQINALAADYRVIAPDLPGTMGRSAPNRFARPGPAHGSWAAGVLAALDIQQAHAIGISNGAWIILKLAEVAPQRIKSAVLISAAGIIRPDWRQGVRLLPVLSLGALLPPEDQSRRFLRLMSPPGCTLTERNIQTMRVILRDYRRESIPGPLADPVLYTLTAPTYLLMGEYDRAFPAAAVIKRARATLPNLQKTEVLAGVAHGMISENPPLVNARLLGWLGGQIT